MSVGLRNAFRYLIRSAKKHRKAKCGHFVKQAKEIVEIFGQKVTIVITVPDHEDPEYCHQCIAATAIRCAWCGEPIIMNDPVTLYSETSHRRAIRDARKHHRDNSLLVGCYRRTCVPMSVIPDGHWEYPGIVVERSVDYFTRKRK